MGLGSGEAGGGWGGVGWGAAGWVGVGWGGSECVDVDAKSPLTETGHLYADKA